MFRTLMLTAFAATIAVPAFADTAVATSTATCSTAAAAKFKPKDDLTALLVKDGLTVKKIKTESRAAGRKEGVWLRNTAASSEPF